MSPPVVRSSSCKSGLAHVCSAASARKVITLSCRSCDACREEEGEEYKVYLRYKRQDRSILQMHGRDYFVSCCQRKRKDSLALARSLSLSRALFLSLPPQRDREIER
jgi:hypothetical protein